MFRNPFTIIAFAAMFSLVATQTFYKLYKIEDNDKIRGITKHHHNDMLAISTTKSVIFGSLQNDFTFLIKNKISLTKNLVGNIYSLLEFTFIGNYSVIICNNIECNICTLNGKCVTKMDSSYSNENIMIQSENDFFFARIFHNESYAAIYSYKLKNGEYSRIGESRDRITAITKFAPITSFSKPGFVYFVNRVMRNKIKSCWNKNTDDIYLAETSIDIVLTQISSTDESKHILSRREIMLSCDNQSATSYFQNGIPLKNKDVLATYSKLTDSLIIAGNSPEFSLFCEFNMSMVENEFCNVFNYCENNVTEISDDCTNGEKIFHNRCLKSLTSKNFCKTNSERNNYLTKAYNANTSQNFVAIETLYPIHGKSNANEINENIIGLFANDQGLFMLQIDKLTKVTKSKASHNLLQFPLEDKLLFTFWDKKSGIIYIDPFTKTSVYFKEIFCNSTVCNEVFYGNSIKCGLCSLNYSNNCTMEERTETICAPFWHTFHINESANFNKTYSITDFNTTYNGVSRRINCFPVKDKSDLNCSRTHKSYLQSSFTVPYYETKLPDSVDNGMNLILLGKVTAIFTMAVIVVICFVYKRKMLRKTRNSYDRFQSVTYTKINNGCLIDKEQIVILKRIGEGYSGIVELANYKNGKEVKKVAVKFLRESNEYELLKEIEELRTCKHTNVVTFIGWMDTENRMAVVTEYMAGGDLHEYISDPNKPLTYSMAFSFIFQILDAMIYLSHKHILHRDLAARNCLLNETFTILKINDFGLARKMNLDYEYYQQNQRALAFRWASIEAITSNFKFTVKLDIWSFAVVIWEIFENGAVPYSNIDHPMTLVKFLQQGKRLPQPSHCSLELYNVLLWCWDGKPEDRPTFDALKGDITTIYNECEKSVPNKLNNSIRTNNYGYEISRS